MVYAILDSRQSAVKIGMSKHPHERLRQLQTACANELQLLFCIDGDSKERLFHEFLSSKGKHIKGEWFCWDKDVAFYLLDVWNWRKKTDFNKEIQHQRSWDDGPLSFGSRHLRLLGLEP